MSRKCKVFMTMMICSLFLSGVLAVSVPAEDYEALKDTKSVKTIFDFRDGNTDTVLIHAQLIHETYKDQAIRAISHNPEFVVVFMDVALLLLSENRDKYTPEEQKQLKELDKVLSAMAKDGIRLEACMFAAKALGVEPDSISPEIHRVGNGWIASLGYQQKGYAVVPAY